MRKKVVQDLIETSREIIRAFWHKDVNLLSHYLDNDVFYCGADPSQYYSSKNELMNYLYSVMNNKDVHSSGLLKKKRKDVLFI